MCLRRPAPVLAGIPKVDDATRWSRQLCFSGILWERSSPGSSNAMFAEPESEPPPPTAWKHFHSSFVSSFATKIKWMWGRGRETPKLQASFHFPLGGWGYKSCCFWGSRHHLASIRGAALTLTQSWASCVISEGGLVQKEMSPEQKQQTRKQLWK